MGFLAPAAPFIVGGTALLGMQQASAIGSYQQAAFDRKAAIAEQKVEALENQLTLDLQKFDKKFKQLEATQVVNTAKSGVAVGTGTAKLIKLSNLYNAEIERVGEMENRGGSRGVSPISTDRRATKTNHRD